MLKLFIHYQIPSDILSYDGPQNASSFEKVSRVYEVVNEINGMIDNIRKGIIDEAKQERDYRKAGSLTGDDIPSIQGNYVPKKIRRTSSLRPENPESYWAPPSQKNDFKENSILNAHEDTPRFVQFSMELEKNFSKGGEDASLRSTVVTAGHIWKRDHFPSLLSRVTKQVLEEDELQSEKEQAFSLLDALSQSGSLAITDASLHVITVLTHCFDKCLMDTVIQDSVNPIEQVEQSILHVASLLFQKSASALVKEDSLEGVSSNINISVQ